MSTEPTATGATGETPDRGLFVVTGGTGFLGEHLVQQLLAQGKRVRLLCRTPGAVNSAEAHPGQVEVVQGSVEDLASLDALFSGAGEVSGVFHLAGVVEHSQRRAAHVWRANVDGTLNVLSAAARGGVRRVVYASTSGTVAVSEGPDLVARDDAPYAVSLTRHWPYYSSKIEAERRAREQAQEQGLELVCMRPTLLLGPGDRRLSSCRTVSDLLNRRIPFRPSGGLSFVDVRDTAAAFIAAMERGTPGATYLLGARNMTLPEFFLLVERLSGVPAPKLRVPTGLAWALATAASMVLGVVGVWNPSLDPVLVEMSSKYWYLDSKIAEEELGFKARDVEETVGDTISWLRRCA